MHWRDILNERDGNAWVALRLELPTTFAARPHLQMQAGPSRCMRIEVCGEPLLWAHVERDRFGYAYLRAVRKEPLALVDPISFSQARECNPTSPTWNRDWARYFARALSESPRGPLYAGVFALASCLTSLTDIPRQEWARRPFAPPATHLGLVSSYGSHDLALWDHQEMAPLPLRNLSDPESSRVKALRKLAREGALPPVLLWWVGGLDRYVILDGHDRFVAALLENKVPACLALLALREIPRRVDPAAVKGVVAQLEGHAARGEILPEPRRENGRLRGVSIDHANRLLIDTFDDRPYAQVMTRAWPLGGGVARWRFEVEAELAAQRLTYVQPELLEEIPS